MYIETRIENHNPPQPPDLSLKSKRRRLGPAGAEEQLKTAKKQEPKKAKTLKRFTFDAGNSNTGVAGLVVSVKAYSKKQAVRLANAYLTSFKEPVDLPVPAGYKDIGVRYAIYCIGANLTIRDIDLEEIAEIADLRE